MTKILIAYDSLSGNTREASRQVAEHLRAAGCEVTEICVSLPKQTPEVSLGDYDMLFLGTWTGGLGRTPGGMKNFLEKILTSDKLPQEIALFGTGETQWGAEHFCQALERINKYTVSRHPLLKIEQMPSSEPALRMIENWVHGIIESCNLSHA